jgi:hypothetical protein
MVFAETIQFGMKFNVDLSKETSADDLPDETEDKMFSSVGDADTFGRCDDDVVVLWNSLSSNTESAHRPCLGGIGLHATVGLFLWLGEDRRAGA